MNEYFYFLLPELNLYVLKINTFDLPVKLNLHLMILDNLSGGQPKVY